MKSLENKEISYSLRNSDNFKTELNIEINQVIEKITQLFIDYFIFITENMKSKNTNFSRFIITRGLDTICSVFKFIMLYTKNLDVTYFHCQKSFYYYVEFVEQISEDEKMFLKLSSRDATTYVYKKTIFDVSDELRKNNESVSDYTKIKLDIINIYIELYKTILLKKINSNMKYSDKLNMIKNIYVKLNTITNRTNILFLNNIVQQMYYQIEDINYFLEVCNLLTKKLIKNNEILNKSNDKLLSNDFIDKINESPEKFVTWLIME